MIAGVPPLSIHRAFEPVLARLSAESVTRFGATGVRLVPVGHEERPFSFLLRVAVWHEGVKQPTGHAFVKISKPKDPAAGIDLRARVARDFETTRSIHDFMSQWDDVGAVRPIVCYEDLLALVTEEAPGETLLQRLRSRAAWFPHADRLADLEATMTNVGRWLKCFQGFEPREGRITLASLLDYVDARLRRLVDQGVITGQYRQRIIQHLNRLGRDVAPADLREVTIHADLGPANILVGGSRVVVLDFAMAGRGSDLHDISRLYLHLDVLRAKPQFRANAIGALQAALLRGLDPALIPGHPLFRYLLMLHRINHLGTLALRRERFLSRVLSARVRRLHRQWMDGELAASERAP